MSGEELYDKIYSNPRKGLNIRKGEPIQTQAYTTFQRIPKPPQSAPKKKSATSFRNANRFFRKMSEGKSNQQTQNGGKFKEINDILSQQHQKLQILEDKITKNILLYTPQEMDRDTIKPKPVPDSIKKIDQQIKQYQRQIEKALKAQLAKEQEDQQREVMDLYENGKKEYDFLTNPQIEHPSREIQEQQKESPPVSVEEPKRSDVNQVYKDFEKMQRHYEHELDKIYIKRENPGVFSKIKKKNPKIYITAKTNTIKKTGEVTDTVEHRMRIYNKEHTPCAPSLILPQFGVKKDQMAQSILAYLKEYSPLVRGEKGYQFPKCIQNMLQDEINTLQNEKKVEIHAQTIEKPSAIDGAASSDKQ